jgi:hypothetical protein
VAGLARRLPRSNAGNAPIIEDMVWQVVGWRRGKIVWWSTFGTRAEALEAVGLKG